MRVWTIAFLFFVSFSSSAADTNSDLFTRCPAERQALARFEDRGATKCQRTLSEVAKCCNLKTCRLQGVDVAATNGNVEGGRMMIAALEALSEGIGKNISMCGNGTINAALPCYSKERGATPADKGYVIEFQNVEGRFERCMKAQKAIADQQIIASGGVVQQSSETPTFGNDAKESDIIQSLQPK